MALTTRAAVKRTPFEQMQALVESDPALQAALWDETDRGMFVTRTIELAHERGLPVSAEMVDDALEHGRARWLDAVNG